MAGLDWRLSLSIPRPGLEGSRLVPRLNDDDDLSNDVNLTFWLQQNLRKVKQVIILNKNINSVKSLYITWCQLLHFMCIFCVSFATDCWKLATDCWLYSSAWLQNVLTISQHFNNNTPSFQDPYQPRWTLKIWFPDVSCLTCSELFKSACFNTY